MRPLSLRRPHLHRPHFSRPHLHAPHLTPDQTIWLLFDRNLRPRAKSYLFQCALATLSLVAILLVQEAIFSAGIVVAVASTAFTIFVFPDSIASRPRRVVGGHIVAILAGSLLFLILQTPSVEALTAGSQLGTNVAAALAVGLGILLMVATNTEHPPPAGVALGIVLDPWQWSALAFVIASALLLTIVRIALKPRLINLL